MSGHETCVFSVLDRPSACILQLFLDPRAPVEEQIPFTMSSTVDYIPPINSIIQNMLQCVTEFLSGKTEEIPVACLVGRHTVACI